MMSQTMGLIPLIPVPRKYGITEKKKAELDALTLQVLDAQFEVDQYQAMVNSLTEKSTTYQGFLTDAEAAKASTLNNRNQVDQLVQMVIDLQSNSNIAAGEMKASDQKMGTLAGQISAVMNKLIYSAEIINKLSALVVRKKGANPLISDDLVTMVNKAGTDANNAVSLTLVALKSVFAARASTMQSESALALEYRQSVDFYNLLTGTETAQASVTADNPANASPSSLRGMLYQAYQNALDNYVKTQKALEMTMRQLNNAQAKLNKAQVKLKSLQSGLAAGNAAALAS